MKILLTSCAECEFGQLERIPRRLWMRLLPSMRNYHCGLCDSTVLISKDAVHRKQLAGSGKVPAPVTLGRAEKEAVTRILGTPGARSKAK